MSDAKDDFMSKLTQATELARRQKAVQEKKLAIEERRTTVELERIEQAEKDLELGRTANFGIMSSEQIARLQKENDEYMVAAKNSLTFINPTFKGLVPYFRKNLILLGAKTGDGKSTTVANIAVQTIRQKHPETGKLCRALIITNEEKAEDFFNRVTCLAKGWHYTNHDEFTDEQRKVFNDYIPILSKCMNVVDDGYAGGTGMTTTIEGIETIFENMLRDGTYYDVVIIDYYQNIKFSSKNPRLNEWEVQAKLAAMLDKYKNIYPAPIVVMAQAEAPTEANPKPFKTRIEGRKVILNVATFAMEIVADRENLRTQWIVHKSRFTKSLGKGIWTGYDKGKYVEYSTEFMREVANIKEKAEMDKISQLTDPKPEKKDETN